jgi:hypothetical protein
LCFKAAAHGFALPPEFAHTGGHYLDDSREARTVPNDADLFQNSHGVKQWAIDPGTAQPPTINSRRAGERRPRTRTPRELAKSMANSW